MNQAIRHGDVILRPIAGLSGNANELAEYTLAHGEVTGHHHTLYSLHEGATIALCEWGKSRQIEIREPWALRHQEHREIIIPPGCYEIGIEREYDPFSRIIERVQD